MFGSCLSFVVDKEVCLPLFRTQYWLNFPFQTSINGCSSIPHSFESLSPLQDFDYRSWSVYTAIYEFNGLSLSLFYFRPRLTINLTIKCMHVPKFIISVPKPGINRQGGVFDRVLFICSVSLPSFLPFPLILPIIAMLFCALILRAYFSNSTLLHSLVSQSLNPSLRSRFFASDGWR